MKLVLRALSLCAAAGAISSSVAQAEVSQKCGTARFTGFYAGLNVGVSSPSTSKSTEVSTTDANGNVTTTKITERHGGLGMRGGLHAGYGAGFGNFGYVGAHVYGNLGGTKIGASTTDSSFKRTHDFGINIDVGGIPNAMQNTILGVGMALEWARYKMNAPEVLDANGAIAQEKISKTITKFGWRPSVFAKTFVTKNVYVGLRGSVGFNGKIKSQGVEVAKHVRDTAVTVELGYKF